MTEKEQKQAAKQFAEFWKDKGYEKGQSQTFWLQLLSQVYGIERPEQFIFAKEYSESVYEILEFASQIYDKMFVISSYEKAETEDEKEMFSDFIYYSVRHTGLSMYFDEDANKMVLNLGFGTLASIIETIFVFNETNNRNEVRLCRYCNKPFIATNLNSFYDKPQCRNNASVRNYRKRKKEEDK